MLRCLKRKRAAVKIVIFILIALLFLVVLEFLGKSSSTFEKEIAYADAIIDKAVGSRQVPSSVFVLPNIPTVKQNPHSACQKGNGSNVLTLFMVITSLQNIVARNVIRRGLKSYLEDDNDGFPRSMDTRHKTNTLLFFIGLPKSPFEQRLLFYEAKTHNDLIIDDMEESYMNLTLKSLRMLKWTQLNCYQAEFTVKLDDDVHVNLKRFLYFLEQRPGTVEGFNLIGGQLHQNQMPVRDPTSSYGKWYTPRHLWAEERFPDYVAGFFYVLGREARRKIYKEALTHPLFHLEDVFITGIIPRKLSGMNITDLNVIATYWTPPLNLITTSCDLRHNYFGIHFFFKRFSYMDCWRNFNDPEFVCSRWPLIAHCWFS